MATDKPLGRVLIVEDDSHVQMAMRTRLLHHGYEVSCAPDGEHARAVIKHQCPDLLILDINLPLKDGLWLAQWVNEEIDKDVPKLVVTASRDPKLRARAADLGADFLEKPFTAPYLLMKVERALNCTTDAADSTVGDY